MWVFGVVVIIRLALRDNVSQWQTLCLNWSLEQKTQTTNLTTKTLNDSNYYNSDPVNVSDVSRIHHHLFWADPLRLPISLLCQNSLFAFWLWTLIAAVITVHFQRWAVELLWITTDRCSKNHARRDTAASWRFSFQSLRCNLSSTAHIPLMKTSISHWQLKYICFLSSIQYVDTSHFL